MSFKLVNTKDFNSKIKNKEFLFSGSVYILLFLFLLHPYRDYDWGWHYRMGEYFIKNGRILWHDPFSWTLPNYVWVNHEWLYNPLQYLIFEHFSFLGMTIFGAIVAFIPFYLGIKRYNLSYWQKGILALFYANLISGVIWQGLRAQMVGVLLIAILFFMLPSALKGNKKTLLVLPFFFLLFTNTHGYFALGLAVFFLMLLGTYISQYKEFLNAQKKGAIFIPKNLVLASISFFASFLVTFINPYHYALYLEAIRHASSPLLPYITEWLPAQFSSTFFALFLAYTAFLIFGFLKRRKIQDLPFLLVFILMAYLAFSARRYFFPFMVLTLPMAALTMKEIPLNFEKYRATAFIGIVAILIGLEIAMFRRIPSFHLFTYTFEDYCNFGSGCSEKLTEYLLKNPPVGRGLNFYDWGGYLIGRGVPAKLFIDGRMHLWESRDGFQPFLSYQKMYYEKDYERFIQDDFDWLILETNSSLSQKLAKDDDLGKWKVGFIDERAVYLIREREQEQTTL